MKLVLISGKRESGKSLLASYLEHEFGFERFSLADDLKKRVLVDFPLIRSSQLWGNEKETPTPYIRTDGSFYTGRDILIRVGSLYRSIDPLFWCKKFDPRIGDKIVCDDLRFINEAHFFLSEYKAKFVRIERKQELKPTPRALDDLSETEMDKYEKWDYRLNEEDNIIPNDLKIFASKIAKSLNV